MTATLKNLGSIFFITFPKTLPFPAAPHPPGEKQGAGPARQGLHPGRYGVW